MTKLQGINFRNTSGFVTDGTGDTYEIIDAPADYPRTTPQGVTVGWEQAIGFTRNRNAGNDPRLAGSASTSTVTNGGVQNFRIDLDASGSHDITIAAGDAAYTAHVKLELFDGTTSLGVLVPVGATSAGNKFFDATGTELSAAAWPGSNTPVTKTFSGAICRFRIGDGANACAIAHVAVTAAAGGGGDVTLAITGNAASGAVGSPGTGSLFSLGATGSAANSNVGSVTPSQGLTGNSSTGQPGNVSPGLTLALSGVAATGFAGNVDIAGDKTLALSGVSAAAAVGTISAAQPRLDAGLPLTKRELQRLRQREKRRQEEIDAAWADRKRERDELRNQVVAAVKGQMAQAQATAAENIANDEGDSEDADLEVLLLYG